jgi:hypothetical protein
MHFKLGPPDTSETMKIAPPKSPLPPLGRAISQGLRGAGYRLEQVAKELGVTHNALRQDLAKSRFYREDLERLCMLAGLQVDLNKLKSSYTFDFKHLVRRIRRVGLSFDSQLQQGEATIQDVLLELTDRMNSVREHIQSVQQVIPKFLRILGKGTVVVIFVSDELPAHWERRKENDWIIELLKAIKRGATMVYLHPAQPVIDQVSPSGVRLLTPEVVKQGFQQFTERLQLAMGQRPSELGCPNLNRRILLIPHDCAALCMPYHKYALYLYRSGPSAVSFATGTIPVSGFHSAEESAHLSYPLLALDEPIRASLQMTLERSIHTLKTSSTIHPELNDALNDILHITTGL